MNYCKTALPAVPAEPDYLRASRLDSRTYLRFPSLWPITCIVTVTAVAAGVAAIRDHAIGRASMLRAKFGITCRKWRRFYHADNSPNYGFVVAIGGHRRGRGRGHRQFPTVDGSGTSCHALV